MAGRAEALLSSGSPGTAVAPFVRVLRSESAKPASYRRREPEKTLLHRTIREHLSTFLRDLEETDVARETPSDLELRRIAGRVARRVRRLFIRRGLLTDDGVPLEQLDEGLPEERAPFGWLTQDGEVILSEPNGAGAGASRGEVAGFSLFASGKVAAKDRERLEQLCRYVARPQLANERLREASDGRIAIASRSHAEVARPTRSSVIEDPAVIRRILAT